MKRKLQISISTCAASFLAFTALAQKPSTPGSGAEYTRQPMDHVRADRLHDAVKASDVIGMTVKNYQDEKLATVEDLAVDVESGRVVQVILSTGGFLGMGDTLTAVPPGVLRHDAARRVILLDTSKEKLKAAPRFDASKWNASTGSNQVIEVYSYYGEEPYFAGRAETDRTSDTDLKRYAALPRHMDGTVDTTAHKTMDQVNNTEVARKVEETSNSISTHNADGTWTRKYYSNENGAIVSCSSLGYVEKASKVIGAPVKNLQDQKLGKVENLVVDLATGRIVAVIISSGGFMGISDELSAVPPGALRFNAGHDALQLDASKETLANSPHFKANEWPDLSQPAYAGRVYRAYKVEPYFATDATTDADNTGANVRDRNHPTMTPMDQGNSPADIKITTQIRKEIIADKDMSLNAHNVKIITNNGQVTLRGAVNSEEEKRAIGEIANRIARSENVDNQLEVKLTTSSNN